MIRNCRMSSARSRTYAKNSVEKYDRCRKLTPRIIRTFHDQWPEKYPKISSGEAEDGTRATHVPEESRRAQLQHWKAESELIESVGLFYKSLYFLIGKCGRHRKMLDQATVRVTSCVGHRQSHRATLGAAIEPHASGFRGSSRTAQLTARRASSKSSTKLVSAREAHDAACRGCANAAMRYTLATSLKSPMTRSASPFTKWAPGVGLRGPIPECKFKCFSGSPSSRAPSA